jgi:hypothetical protein
VRFTTIASIIIIIISAVCFSLSVSATEHTLRFSKSAAGKLGTINKLKVWVDCGHVSSLRNIPELYNIDMGYEIPMQNILEAWPRLGAAAVQLSQWDGVIAVLSESDSCFAVRVEAEDMDGKNVKLNGRQLGITK